MWKVEFRSTDSCRSLCTAFLWRAVLLVAFCEWTPSVVALSGIGFLALPLKPPGYPCQDNEDCGFDTDHYRAIPCCLMVDVEHGRPVGICQPSLTLGELCAPGERLRDFYGYNVYQTSCPCHRGLRCVPAQQWYTPEMVLVNMNPTCRSPEDEDASSSSSVRTRVTTEEPSRVTRV
ncbi:unnamed protein product [Cyprideis torosa]|uniref:Uncharacterized protein n=1 Tax=Cyprideis torosa TaxID=163714 RepID=A0A7R8WGR9_9CRUS|nr:unnamed protein product [Cyprideis torosa]CAG0896930.1 unnamed protein product [Cyprideis torosa]